MQESKEESEEERGRIQAEGTPAPPDSNDEDIILGESPMEK